MTDTRAVRVLVIDEDPAIQDLLDMALPDSDWTLDAQGFDRIKEGLVRFRPDLVVLDLVEGDPADDKIAGNESFEEIWRTWFCPVVVYSAFPDHWGHEAHPWVRIVKKGEGTQREVRKELQELWPMAGMIRDVHEYYDRNIRHALSDSMRALSDQFGTDENEIEDEVLLRAVRRLVAARADVETPGDATLQAWERLVVPPLGREPLTADVLRRKHTPWTETSAHRLVLTPSCDLTSHGGGSTKADTVLVAQCETLRALGKLTFEHGRALSSRQRDELRRILTEGSADGRLVVPEFGGHVPLMVANLRKLELIPLNRIDLGRGLCDSDKAEFKRVASTDSPFREMVVWAYLRVTGRPGMPESDVDQWMDDISDHFEASAQQ